MSLLSFLDLEKEDDLIDQGLGKGPTEGQDHLVEDTASVVVVLVMVKNIPLHHRLLRQGVLGKCRYGIKL